MSNAKRQCEQRNRKSRKHGACQPRKPGVRREDVRGQLAPREKQPHAAVGASSSDYLISSVRQMHPYSLAEVRAAVAEAARRIVCDQLIQQAGKKLVLQEHTTEGTPLRALVRRNPAPAPAPAQTSVPIILLKSLECHLAICRDGITMKTLILFRLGLRPARMSSREYIPREFHGVGTQAHASHPTLPKDRAASDLVGHPLRAL